MKFGKTNKDGSINATINDKEDDLLYNERVIVSFLNEIVSECPESKFFGGTTDFSVRRIHIPSKLIGKIQTIGIIRILKRCVDQNDITHGRCLTKRIRKNAGNKMLVLPNQASKEKQNMTQKTSASTLTYARAKVLVRKTGIRNIQKYVYLRTKGQLPAGLPSNPATTYARYWKGWPEFCGTTAK